MRKLLIMSLLVLTIVGVAGLNIARAETMTNDTYDWLIHAKNVCGHCADKCHSCKDKCEPACKPACEPKCKPACEPQCEPKCAPKCHKCCPQIPSEFPDACKGSDDPMTRDGLSRSKV
jgi:hypothetical protein